MFVLRSYRALSISLFLHVPLREPKREDLQLILFSTLIVLLMVWGTLVALLTCDADDVTDYILGTGMFRLTPKSAANDLVAMFDESKSTARPDLQR
jgi:hypothetical protein